MAGMNGDRFNDREGAGDRRERHQRDDRRDRDRDRGDRRDRRRSRSPRDRDRGARREDGDNYSSSRYDRNREREDRYRRDDRGWDRDRGDRDRGDRRRRDFDDRRGGRGDRDLFEGDRRGPRGDRGGGDRRGGQDRQDRDEFAAQARGKKSPTPPPRKREPTPDLTDVTSVLTRKRRLTQWDIKPPGYENVTAEQAKLSGMFPLPGAPRQQVMDPTKLQSLISASGGGAEAAALKPSSSRQAKRLVVSNLPPSASDESVVNYFNLQMNGLNIVESIDPCISCHFSSDRGYAMVEFKNPSEATLALAFDGQAMDDTQTAGAGIAIRRPKDYIVSTVSDEEQQPAEGVVSSTVPDTANKICVSNILTNLTQEQVQSLLVSFGVLRSLVLVRDRGNEEESRGIAFCEFMDPEVTDQAVEGLNGMDLGGMSLKVQKASIGYAQTTTLEMSVNAMSMLAGTTSDNIEDGRVLQLLNMVTADELIDQQDYDEIVEDVQEECSKFGKVLEIKVPRPSMGSRQSSGVGKIFIKYDTPENAGKAMAALAGRKFADRTVVVTYFSEESFDTNTW